MGQMYAFHETVRGHLHIMNEIPCEDASASFSAEDGSFFIAAVADGHGAKACFRSRLGSKIAVDVSMECLRQFAETILKTEEIENQFYGDVFMNPRYRQMTIRRLTDIILAQWHDRVLKDYNVNFPSQEEMGESAEEYETVKNPLEIYGTTLIAALWLPKGLILLQQGDGRCDIFFSDGTVEQPIPWDSRCEGTATTSLCNKDAAESFRSCVLDLTEKPVIACYLGCDGVEDAYRDTYAELGGSHILMGGVHTFYKDLTCQMATMDRETFEKYLHTMLAEFSQKGRFSRGGSGDDVSVAGIVDMSAIKSFTVQFQMDVKRYALEEELFWKEDALRSKTRKHEFLKKSMLSVQEELEKIHRMQIEADAKLDCLKEKREKLLETVSREKAEMEIYREESQSYQKEAQPNMDRIGSIYMKIAPDIIQCFCQCLETLFAGCSTRETAYHKAMEELDELDEQIESARQIQTKYAEDVRQQEAKLDEAKRAFEEYDDKYQEIKAQREEIEREIVALEKTEVPLRVPAKKKKYPLMHMINFMGKGAETNDNS